MKFTHLTESGAAHMVDVSAKQPTVRTATARGEVACSPQVLAVLRDGTVPKGDVLAVARVAGIAAAKKGAGPAAIGAHHWGARLPG